MEYDKDGELGRKGTVHQETVDEVLSHPYFTKALPKTTGELGVPTQTTFLRSTSSLRSLRCCSLSGREVFGDDLAASLVTRLRDKGLTDESIIATLTRITAQSLVQAYERYLPQGRTIDDLYMCGGGAFNPNIVNFLREKMPGTKIGMLDEMGVPVSLSTISVPSSKLTLCFFVPRAAL
jgi:1,6-anhydro-N-acetylmuramate kinase